MRSIGNKFGAIKTEVDGIIFHSKGEAGRYQELKLSVAAKKISKLKLQPRFPMVVNGKKIGTYVADFQYLPDDSDMEVVEDFKGFKTAVYKLKAKLFQALYPQFLFIETN